MIRIQEEDFDISELQTYLRNAVPSKIGAICLFTGLVREFGDQAGVTSIELEHYPGMTEKQLQRIVSQAEEQWPILASCVVHRVGKLALDEQIVAVAVSSSHREAAFEACSFIMDFLKRDATIWKKETGEKSDWVAQKESDARKAEQWQQN